MTSKLKALGHHLQGAWKCGGSSGSSRPHNLFKHCGGVSHYNDDM